MKARPPSLNGATYFQPRPQLVPLSHQYPSWASTAGNSAQLSKSPSAEFLVAISAVTGN